jgi:hypothetical protein
MLWLKSSDEIELAYLRAIGERMIEINEERIERSAKYIIHELSKALAKGNKKQGQRQNSSSTR